MRMDSHNPNFSVASFSKLVFFALTLASQFGAAAAPQKPADQPPGSDLGQITVEATRDRQVLQQRVNGFVSGITEAPYLESLARWNKETPICPQVAGLPYDDGEYMLTRFSEIAGAAGATLAPNVCRPNLFVLVSSVPDELIAEWSKRNAWMFGKTGGTKVRRFMHAPDPIRVWYTIALVNGDGTPCRVFDEELAHCEQGSEISQIRLEALRDLTAVIVLVDARRIKDINMGQLAAYVAMVGLAEIRVDAKPGDAPTILHLFSDQANTSQLGMSDWDKAYLQALYHTEHTDKTQLLALKASMLNNLAPR